ncbi:MAG: pyridoxal phosphate-dependent aminotransferase [Lachnospiraceae bacterium]|nr:pyridoxal phosphate-dependent aminotransferase [Lachnospiraceae bacterium]
MFDFDKKVDRRGTDSYKWDVAENELPMWVADMDFETAPCVREAIEKRAAHGVFGYNVVPDEWYEAYQSWWETRHHLKIEKDWLIFCTGVVPALSSIVRKMTTVGENVLILTPVYNIFFNSIVNNGRNVVQCPLRYRPRLNGTEMAADYQSMGKVEVGNEENSSLVLQEYDIDFDALEEALSNPQTTLLIFCNPHNPVGRIWTREELAKVGELCKKHHVLVVSDEIHCDLTDPGKEYVPFASVSDACRENSVTCIAPTKAFNMAGMQTAAVFASDPVIRHKVWRGLNTDEVAEPNSFACGVTVAAFTKGAPWLDALREYLFKNKQVVQEFVATELPMVHLVPSEATYLLWLDCSAYTSNSVELAEFIRKETGLYVSEGAEYGKAGEQFLRLNIACPREQVREGLTRLKKGLQAYEA